MISRKHRFHGHGSLRYVYQNGRMVRGSMLSLKYIENRRRKDYRLAVVVSKKIHKSAVVRNRIRRRLYEVVRRRSDGITAPFDMVLIVHSDQLAELPGSEIEALVGDQLRRAGILAPRARPSRAKIEP